MVTELSEKSGGDVMRSDQIETVVLDERDIPSCIALAEASFDDFLGRPDVVAAWFAARIVGNPWQSQLPGVGVGLRRDGALVAFRAMFAQPWWLLGAPTVVAFAAHTAVDPRFRGQGLGTRLIDASRTFAAVTGSTTAGDITQKSYARLGFTPVGGEDNGFFRLRVSYVGSLRRRLGDGVGAWATRLLDLRLVLRDRRLGSTAGFRLQPVSRCDEAFDRLWERVRVGQISCLERSSYYFNWRLFDCPTAALRLSALRDVSGGLRGCAVWTTTRYSTCVEVAVLRDWMVPPDDSRAANAMLRLLIGHWRELGLTWASLEVTSPQLERFFREQGYEHVPSHGNRYHIHSQPALEARVYDNWFRSGLDGDYFDLQG